jgi:3-deoxy-manno-octulosonate cytidylyltransferase (CMP-KDO synthetase)
MTTTPRVAGLIPARMKASRFPGKPIARIAGLPMIEHVYRRSVMNRRFSEVCVATCDREIAEASEAFGCRAIMTSDLHQRGTDRVAEAAQAVDADIIVNIQGDEPLIHPGIFDELLAPFDDPRNADLGCTNLMAALHSDEEQDSLNNVKVAVDLRGRAMYFSREPIPSRRMGARPSYMFRQIGIYAFRAPVLRAFSTLSPTPSEIAESCDMMRFVEHGYPIQMVPTAIPLQSVDTPEDLALAERLMQDDPLFQAYAGAARR